MMAGGFQLPRWASTRSSFDPLVEHASSSRLSFEEAELLRDSHWSLGEDARLREDIRFRPTPWGRWIPTMAYLANDAVFKHLHREPRNRSQLEDLLAELDRLVARRCVFCPGDPRFVLQGGTIRLSARELTSQPLVEREVTDLEKYVTHLPVHSLRAAAASQPAGEWGPNAQEQAIATLGWVQVTLDRKLTPRMFVAQIEGKSMDDGRSGLVDGGFAVFELWPAGTKQLLSVLVRGAFADPETGGYSVKKYVADPRDEEGRHRRITLVSLNPDKHRYPDIELDVERDDDVTVVAKVVQALSPDQFVRRPRPLRRPGRRDLASTEVLAEIADDLQAHTARFFDEVPIVDEVEAERVRRGWHADLVCLAAEAGGLHIEVGPLVGLWSFVKQLRVSGRDATAIVLASNVRLRPERTAVPPAAGPWTWQAVGYEDDADVDVSALAVPALAADAPVVFRVDASDVGRRVATRTLSPGQQYRVLLADRVLASLAHKPTVSRAGEGWSLWELDLSSTVLAEVHAILRDLGLEIGEGAATLDWVLVPPVAWRITPAGDSYPCFLATPPPVLEVGGPSIDADGAAAIFLHGPRGQELLPLPAGSRHLVQLQDLVPGRYSVLALHDHTSVARERLAFEVLSAAPDGPSARWQVRAMEAVEAPPPGTARVFSARDLAGLTQPSSAGDEPAFRVDVPPGWPVRVLWNELTEDAIMSLHADRDGVVDTHALGIASSERRTRRLLGDLVLDFAELGAATLRHEQRRTVETVRNRVAELVAARGATVQRSAGRYADLVSLWFEPICFALGYYVEAIPVDDSTEAPEYVSVFRLVCPERRGARIELHVPRLLLLVEDLSNAPSEVLLTWLDDVCAAERLRDVLISDGLRWTEHRRGLRFPPEVWDLATAADNPTAFMDFLRVAAEGVR